MPDPLHTSGILPRWGLPRVVSHRSTCHRERQIKASAVQQDGAGDVAPLKVTVLLLIAVPHDLRSVRGMVEANGVTYLMRESVEQVVALQVAIKTDFPPLHRIETDERLCDGLGTAGRPAVVEHVRERPADGV